MGSGYQRPEWKTTADLLKLLDDADARARKALAATTDEHLMTTWRMLAAGRLVDESPRHVVIADAFPPTWGTTAASFPCTCA